MQIVNLNVHTGIMHLLWEERSTRIETQRADLRDLLTTVSTRHGLFRGDFEIALELASKFDLLFENDNNKSWRLLSETVFEQVRVRDGKITGFELNPSFALISSRGKGMEPVLSRQPIKTHSELLFGKKSLIPALQQLLTIGSQPL